MSKVITVAITGVLAAWLLTRRGRAQPPALPSQHLPKRPPSLGQRLFTSGFVTLNRYVEWYKLPAFLGALNLVALRNVLRERNLHDTQTLPSSDPDSGQPVRYLTSRSPDGSYNDLEFPRMGAAGARFGRNVPLEYGYPESRESVMTPNPRVVSTELLVRHQFQPATILNLLAAAWLQFMVHDWFVHSRDEAETAKPWQLPIPPGDTWPESQMTIHPTKFDPHVEPEDAQRPPVYANDSAHWWDASQVYGSNEEDLAKLRSGVNGQLIIQSDGLLPLDPKTGLDATGMTDNWWLGLSLLHTLFTREHNAICDHLKRSYPTWTDDQLFDHARLVNAALQAKIHTVEWTTCILPHPALQIGMRGVWWGALGEQIYRKFGRVSSSDVLAGIPGSPKDHHGAYYAMTEEFTAVYRMHPLLPDDYSFRSLTNNQVIRESDFHGVAGRNSRQHVEQIAMADLLYSFGTSHPGAVTLHNYPRSLQFLQQDDGSILDIGSIDILRDRERGIPRYNQFRQLLHKPAVRSFEELTNNPDWREEIRRVYDNDIDSVDTMVGLYAEPLPPGFGFSDTAFRVFILMATRRLKSDRFFTTDYTPAVYTPEGLRWIDDNTMKTVLVRHFPELEPVLRGVENGFAPWPVAG